MNADSKRRRNRIRGHCESITPKKCCFNCLKCHRCVAGGADSMRCINGRYKDFVPKWR